MPGRVVYKMTVLVTGKIMIKAVSVSVSVSALSHGQTDDPWFAYLNFA